MRNGIRLALMLALALPAMQALASPLRSNAPPEFTTEEQSVIHRNSALDRVVRRDPWLVRRVLDAIAGAAAEPPSEFSDRSSIRRKPERPPDPERNPDLDQLGRASPEAAHDLFLLIKKAAAGGKR